MRHNVYAFFYVKSISYKNQRSDIQQKLIYSLCPKVGVESELRVTTHSYFQPKSACGQRTPFNLDWLNYIRIIDFFQSRTDMTLFAHLYFCFFWFVLLFSV
jgi:hypothetical protein